MLNTAKQYSLQGKNKPRNIKVKCRHKRYERDRMLQQHRQSYHQGLAHVLS